MGSDVIHDIRQNPIAFQRVPEHQPGARGFAPHRLGLRNSYAAAVRPGLIVCQTENGAAQDRSRLAIRDDHYQGAFLRKLRGHAGAVPGVFNCEIAGAGLDPNCRWWWWCVRNRWRRVRFDGDSTRHVGEGGELSYRFQARLKIGWFH